MHPERKSWGSFGFDKATGWSGIATNRVAAARLLYAAQWYFPCKQRCGSGENCVRQKNHLKSCCCNHLRLGIPGVAAVCDHGGEDRAGIGSPQGHRHEQDSTRQSGSQGCSNGPRELDEASRYAERRWSRRDLHSELHHRHGGAHCYDRSSQSLGENASFWTFSGHQVPQGNEPDIFCVECGRPDDGGPRPVCEALGCGISLSAHRLV